MFVDIKGVIYLVVEGIIGSLLNTLGVELSISPIFSDVPSNICFNLK
jgi:hypothetical protein